MVTGVWKVFSTVNWVGKQTANKDVQNLSYCKLVNLYLEILDLLFSSVFKSFHFRPALQLLLLPSLKPRLRQTQLFCTEDMAMVLVMGMLV